MGGDRRSAGTEAHAATILARVEARPDLTLEELRVALAAEGVAVSYGALWRFLHRHKITRKKSRRTPPNRNAPTS
jgi:transposase